MGERRGRAVRTPASKLPHLVKKQRQAGDTAPRPRKPQRPGK